jgi:muramoyltetrapeptide carboxypeptidase
MSSAVESLIAPPYLKKGDTVAIVAMASKLERKSIEAAVEEIESWGLNVIIGESVGASDFDFAGTDEIRLRDFQEMLDDKNVRAIFSARGGYGSSRIIDQVNFASFVSHPKWIVGFSDITAVHGKIQNLGFQSIHGPMPKTMFWDAKSDECLQGILFGKNVKYNHSTYKLNRLGEGIGQVVGGNLALLAHGIGTSSELDFVEKILFIEDVGEYLYNLDRLMVQLKRAGKLSNLAGLIVGQFSDVKENDEPFGKTAYEIIEEYVSQKDYPVAYDFPVGHTNDNWPLRCGEAMQLIVKKKGVILQSLPSQQ